MEVNSEAFKVLLKSILDESLEAKLDPIIKSLTFISNQYDELSQRTASLEEINKTLSKNNYLLKEKLSKCENQLVQIKSTLNDQEQYSRRECLEIRGIPTINDEDTNQITMVVASLISITLEESDISVSHRLFKSRRDRNDNTKSCPPIIVKFSRRDTRDHLYKQRNLLKSHSRAEITNLSRISANKIFISESLTQYNRYLFNSCLAFKRSNNFKYLHFVSALSIVNAL
jgi:small-conductance mechanosensitive channel